MITTCQFCNAEVNDTAAILFSPSDDMEPLRKLHVCPDCYGKLMVPPLVVGQEVYDALTRHRCKVVGIKYDNGKTTHGNVTACHAWGIWVDDPYLGGARYPWEVDRLQDCELLAGEPPGIKVEQIGGQPGA